MRSGLPTPERSRRGALCGLSPCVTCTGRTSDLVATEGACNAVSDTCWSPTVLRRSWTGSPRALIAWLWGFDWHVVRAGRGFAAVVQTHAMGHAWAWRERQS